MAHWSHKNHSKNAWEYYLNELDCDILLFQESSPNYDVVDKYKVVWNSIGDNRPWGSGIYSKNHKIKEFNFKNSFFGAVTGAEIEINENLNLIFISLYCVFEKIDNVVYAVPNFHRILSDLTGVLQSRKSKNRIIIGGDFNVSIQIDLDPSFPDKDNKLVFDRLENFDLLNCYKNFYPDFVQTHRHSRSSKPWQNDYFFISQKLENKLLSCKVIENEKVFEYSDHNPVVIELDF